MTPSRARYGASPAAADAFSGANEPYPKAGARGLRVVIVEPFDLLRDGIRAALSDCEDVAAVQEVSTDLEGLARLDHASPDVALVAMDSRQRDGLGTLRRVARALPDVPIVVLGQEAGPSALLAAIRAGARGYVLGGVGRATLPAALKAAASGCFVIDPAVACGLLDQRAPRPAFEGSAGRHLTDSSLLNSLSPREMELLRLVAQGLRDKEIAAALHLSLGTVKTHLRHIYHRLRVPGRVGAILAVLGEAPDAGHPS